MTDFIEIAGFSRRTRIFRFFCPPSCVNLLLKPMMNSTRMFPFALAAMVATAAVSVAQSALPSPKEVEAKMLTVAKWQRANPSKHNVLDWTMAPYDVGLLALARATGDDSWADDVRKMGRGKDWKLGAKPFFADDHAVGQAWLALYFQDQQPEQLTPTLESMKRFTGRPLAKSLEFSDDSYHNELVWCDSLFMAPPVIAGLATATGDQKWLERMDARYWALKEYLYDPEERLFFRDSRFFKKPEANGKKTFWGRGNGWVVAGLPHVIEHMPLGSPLRAKYEKLFQDLVTRVIELQQPDGSWHASLLDPASYPVPESSGTAFFCYGILWGINEGILDREKSLPAALKAWTLLNGHILEDGRLGYVQPIGEDPQKVTAEMTEVYGTGGFLLAGSELIKMIQLEGAKTAEVSVKNDTTLNRLNEVTEMPWAKVEAQLPGVKPESIAVRDLQTGRFVTTQVVIKEDKPSELLFLASTQPGQSRRYQLVQTQQQPAASRSRVHARYVPERKDDFAFENDRLGFRLYGPRLAAENSKGGLDVWMKRTRELVQDRWYKLDKYHVDAGEGCDCYHVGPTLGAGGLGYLDKDGKITPSPVYAKHQLIASGPLRAEIELEYGPVTLGSGTVTETRHVILDLGSSFARFTSSFKTTGTPEARVMAGLRTEVNEEAWLSPGVVANWGYPEGKVDTMIGTGLVAVDGKPSFGEGHVQLILSDGFSKPVTWLAGAGFSKTTDIPTFTVWQDAGKLALQKLQKPLTVE
jgi:unsaturated rhamnogalacturonyl hydrolase